MDTKKTMTTNIEKWLSHPQLALCTPPGLPTANPAAAWACLSDSEYDGQREPSEDEPTQDESSSQPDTANVRMPPSTQTATGPLRFDSMLNQPFGELFGASDPDWTKDGTAGRAGVSGPLGVTNAAADDYSSSSSPSDTSVASWGSDSVDGTWGAAYVSGPLVPSGAAPTSDGSSSSQSDGSEESNMEVLAANVTVSADPAANEHSPPTSTSRGTASELPANSTLWQSPSAAPHADFPLYTPPASNAEEDLPSLSQTSASSSQCGGSSSETSSDSTTPAPIRTAEEMEMEQLIARAQSGSWPPFGARAPSPRPEPDSTDTGRDETARARALDLLCTVWGVGRDGCLCCEGRGRQLRRWCD